MIFEEPKDPGYHSLNDLAKFRLARAYETFEEANDAYSKSHYNGAVNRLYYSCFYAVNALLIKDKLFSKTHAGIKALFHDNFIRTSKLNDRFGAIYDNLFDQRMKGDYEDFITYEKEDIEPLIENVKLFLEAITQLIQLP